MSRKPKQMGLALPAPKTWGGKRKNSGRKPTRKGSWIKHRPRPWHDANQPVHVTLKVKRGVPSLRGHKVAGAIGAGLRHAATASWARQKARRRTFRVVHFSIQPNHVHLIVEATSKTALARGVQGLASGLARRVNNRLGRSGSLFADRYHGRALATPTEVRNAIVYVYKNYEKHPVGIADRGTEPRHGIDPCSSASWFAGWSRPPPPPRVAAPPVAEPKTWLMRVSWKRRGLLRRDERPATAPATSS